MGALWQASQTGGLCSVPSLQLSQQPGARMRLTGCCGLCSQADTVLLQKLPPIRSCRMPLNTAASGDQQVWTHIKICGQAQQQGGSRYSALLQDFEA